MRALSEVITVINSCSLPNAKGHFNNKVLSAHPIADAFWGYRPPFASIVERPICFGFFVFFFPPLAQVLHSLLATL